MHFSTKATHIELVSDLTSEAFLAALKRFIARRGRPDELFSDNGSNFKGAHNTLQDLYRFLASDTSHKSTRNYLLENRTSWTFSPEHALHFGGLWEAAVESAKLHLKKVIGQQTLNFEEFSTLLCQVESCLNSRPLVPLSSHPEDGIAALTPGHFLIGRPLNSLPETDLTDVKSPLKRWSLVQNITQHWWRWWSMEYLQQLQRFSKWTTPKRKCNCWRPRHDTREISIYHTLATRKDYFCFSGKRWNSSCRASSNSNFDVQETNSEDCSDTSCRKLKGPVVLWWAACLGPAKQTELL